MQHFRLLRSNKINFPTEIVCLYSFHWFLLWRELLRKSIATAFKLHVELITDRHHPYIASRAPNHSHNWTFWAFRLTFLPIDSVSVWLLAGRQTAQVDFIKIRRCNTNQYSETLFNVCCSIWLSVRSFSARRRSVSFLLLYACLIQLRNDLNTFIHSLMTISIISNKQTYALYPNHLRCARAHQIRSTFYCFDALIIYLLIYIIVFHLCLSFDVVAWASRATHANIHSRKVFTLH